MDQPPLGLPLTHGGPRTHPPAHPASSFLLRAFAMAMWDIIVISPDARRRELVDMSATFTLPLDDDDPNRLCIATV